MAALIIGVINNILWALFSLGIYALKWIPHDILCTITEFMHKYFLWYFDWKIAHLLSLAAIVYAVYELIRGKMGWAMFLFCIFLNAAWFIIYMFAYLN